MTRAALLAFLCLLPAACAAGPDDTAALEALASTATRLHFTTSSEPGGNPPPDVDVTVTDPAKVSALFEATIALPGVPSGFMSECLTLGVFYHLAFTSGPTTTEFDIDVAGGCSWITVQGYPPVVPDDAYYALLASTLGVPEATIYPYNPP